MIHEIKLELLEVANQLELKLASYSNEYKDIEKDKLALYSVFSIRVALSLAKLFVYSGRTIDESENQWFKGSRFHHDIYVGGKFQDIYSNYCLMSDLLKKLQSN